MHCNGTVTHSDTMCISYQDVKQYAWLPGWILLDQIGFYLYSWLQWSRLIGLGWIAGLSGLVGVGWDKSWI